MPTWNHEGATITPEGGYALRLLNKTGEVSVKGTLVECSATTDFAVQLATAATLDPIGVIYESGMADGSPVLVVTGGIADVLIRDGTAATRKYWARVSDTVAGRANITTAAPPGAVLNHFKEIGHALQSVSSGTDKLCRIAMHFL